MGFVQEFKDFLTEYKVMGLAIAFIMGVAVTDLVKSLVQNMIMPVVTALMANVTLENAKLVIGSIEITWGAFVASLINFLIIGLVVFLLAKFILGEAKVTKK